MTDKESKQADDHELGMDRKIDRRDFLNGLAVSALALTTAPAFGADGAPQDLPTYYPPVLNGMRGDNPGSFEVAHALRDGRFWATAKHFEDLNHVYDLVISGAGISGLSAAYFYRQAVPDARILILDNHDDFGGHARRNEFHLRHHLELLNGGTMLIDSPRPYSRVASTLLDELGIKPTALAKACDRPGIYRELKLGGSTFFDAETFGQDKLVPGQGMSWANGGKHVSWSDFLQQAPLSDVVKQDILRIETGTEDYMPGLTSDEKKDRLSRISYRDFLLDIVKANPGVIPFYQARTHGEWGVGIDAEPALDCWAMGLPGFQGLHLKPGAIHRMGNTAAGYEATGGSAKFHFPDGNASIARLLVRALIPAAMPGHTVEDVVTAKAVYDELDRATQAVRIRLSSTVVGARNIGHPDSSQGVEIAYSRMGEVYRVRAKSCILASWNMMIPYICPELPEKQKEALHQLVKVPLVYVSVGLRNWHAFDRLGISGIYSPGSYYSSTFLNMPVDIGSYKSVRSPDEPILIQMVRTPCKPGLPERDQHRAGRYELLATSLETFERNVRNQLGRMLKDGGFNPAEDIMAITVNRWAHGYAYEYNPLFDNFNTPYDQLPNVVGRKRFGRITIANSDSGAAAYTDSAIDQAHRAVQELVTLERL
ncbi:MAG: NAD(P)/FAD-dependent oxidoreductase [Alphaproteobacteria bacterium]|nr:NAD(P)/FAD-dependent oxidoreductase [Alphaproteobacteria bacterium]